MGREKKITITRNGQEVDCYGDFEETSNVSIVCDNDRWDGIYCNDDGCTNWTEVVNVLTKWAASKGTEVVELGAC